VFGAYEGRKKRKEKAERRKEGRGRMKKYP